MAKGGIVQSVGSRPQADTKWLSGYSVEIYGDEFFKNAEISVEAGAMKNTLIHQDKCDCMQAQSRTGINVHHACHTYVYTGKDHCWCNGFLFQYVHLIHSHNFLVAHLFIVFNAQFLERPKHALEGRKGTFLHLLPALSCKNMIVVYSTWPACRDAGGEAEMNMWRTRKPRKAHNVLTMCRESKDVVLSTACKPLENWLTAKQITEQQSFPSFGFHIHELISLILWMYSRVSLPLNTV